MRNTRRRTEPSRLIPNCAEGVGLEPTSPCGRRFSRPSTWLPSDCATAFLRLIHADTEGPLHALSPSLPIDLGKRMSPECQSWVLHSACSRTPWLRDGWLCL